MKFRRGFVANSSSASYYVVLSGELSVIDDMLIAACEWALWDGDLQESLTQNIQRISRSIANIESGTERFLIDTIDSLKEQLKKNKDALTFITSAVYTSENYHSTMLDICLEAYGVKRTNVYNGDVKLEAFTVMHNDYTQGMPRILQEAILSCTFGEFPIKFSCKKEND
jgi:hypothetical protein